MTLQLVEPAAPHQLAIVDGHVGAAIAHVGLAVGHHVDRLDERDALDVEAAADISGTGGGATAWSTTSDSLSIYTTDTSDVVLIGTAATSTRGNIMEVLGNILARGNTVVTGYLTHIPLVQMRRLATFSRGGVQNTDSGTPR